jgi:nifR3 family TIM-barrel protein
MQLDNGAAFTIGGVPVYGNLILAPMAGYTDQPYRTLCRAMGSAMSYTEFVSVQGLLHANQRTFELLRFDPQERPIVFQVFGQDPEAVLAACQRLEELGPDVIDINMGCPAPRVSRRGVVAGLLRDPARIAHIFALLSKRLSVPVTAKIRLGWDAASRNYLQVARVLEENGAALIAVHGRTRADSYETPADWDAIAAVAQAVHIPVLGNGDVHCAGDVERMAAHTGCDGVMIGRAAIGNPWIFERRDREDVPLEERIDVVGRHLARMVAFYGERRGVVSFRKHVVRYLRGLPGAAQARAALMQCLTQAQVLEQLDQLVQSSRQAAE